LSPDLKLLDQKQLIGMHMSMSLTDDKTRELWKKFMPQRKLILNPANAFLYSLQIYPHAYFSRFGPACIFEKWAAVEVNAAATIPEGMESLLFPGGLYAVFHYKCQSTDGSQLFDFIFNTWLPQSNYRIDNRPHFEFTWRKV
jgi:AraC family transcriptional regulator